jgi:hypothetical protein
MPRNFCRRIGVGTRRGSGCVESLWLSLFCTMMNAPVGSRRPGAGKAGGILSFRSKQLKKGMTRNQLLDGGSIAQLRTAVNLTGGEASDDEQRLGVDVAGDYKINYGMGMAADPRLRAALIRENFFLSVLIPRTRHVMLRSVAAFFTWPRTLVIIGLTAIYVSCAYTCAYTHPNGLGNTFCNGGPIGNGGEQRAFTFVDYRAAILNSLAAMLLSFYVSAVVTMYKEACEPMSPPSPALRQPTSRPALLAMQLLSPLEQGWSRRSHHTSDAPPFAVPCSTRVAARRRCGTVRRHGVRERQVADDAVHVLLRLGDG